MGYVCPFFRSFLNPRICLRLLAIFAQLTKEIANFSKKENSCMWASSSVDLKVATCATSEARCNVRVKRTDALTPLLCNLFFPLPL